MSANRRPLLASVALAVVAGCAPMRRTPPLAAGLCCRPELVPQAGWYGFLAQSPDAIGRTIEAIEIWRHEPTLPLDGGAPCHAFRFIRAPRGGGIYVAEMTWPCYQISTLAQFLHDNRTDSIWAAPLVTPLTPEQELALWVHCQSRVGQAYGMPMLLEFLFTERPTYIGNGVCSTAAVGADAQGLGCPPPRPMATYTPSNLLALPTVGEPMLIQPIIPGDLP